MAEPAPSKPEPLSIIIGTSDPLLALTVSKELCGKGYQVATAGSKEKLIERVELRKGDKVCIMDANLDKPESTIDKSVSELAQHYDKSEGVYCIVLAEDPDLVSEMIKKGICCDDSKKPERIIDLVGGIVNRLGY